PGGKDDADRLGVVLIEPSGEGLRWLRRQAAVVEMQLLLEPVITGHERALCRLLGTAYYFVREKLAERRRQLGLGIRLAGGSHKEAGIVLHAGKATAEQVFLVMQQHMPLALFGKSCDGCFFNEFFQVGIVTRSRDRR